jgi:hypothetical protein
MSPAIQYQTPAEQGVTKMTAHQHRPAKHAGLVVPPENGVGVLCLHRSLIALINASNRLGVITRQHGGDYQTSQFG